MTKDLEYLEMKCFNTVRPFSYIYLYLHSALLVKEKENKKQTKKK